jgi:glycoprotein-N-acetylgalactosamine 3-beta-galactosyltransferase
VRTIPSYYERALSVYETWGKVCYTVFISSNFTTRLPVIPYDEILPYENLTSQTYKMIPKIYKAYPHFKWYYFADDNTFLNFENLEKFLSDKSHEDPYIYGEHFNDYLSGGAGYVIPNHGIQKLVNTLKTNIKFCPNTGVDDRDLIQCLKKLDFLLGETKDKNGKSRFHPYNVYHHMKNDEKCCAVDYISFHYILPKQMYYLYKIKLELANTFKLIKPIFSKVFN